MIMHAFKDYHFLELQDDNGDIMGYTASELFDHLMDQYVQPEDVADQVTALHKILEQEYDPNEVPQVYYKTVQDEKTTLESLNATIDEATLIRHGLNQFKEHIDLKLDIKERKQLPRLDKTWKKFKSHFTKAINNNKSDKGTLRAIETANAVKEQVDQNKENQWILAQQATMEASEKIDLLEKQTAQLCAALMAKQPQQPPLQDTTAATIKALTDKTNKLKSGSGGSRNGGRGRGDCISLGSDSFLYNNDGGTRKTR